MNTLLIWEENPENVSLYLIPNEIADRHRHHFEAAHGKMINCDDMSEGMEFINIALQSSEDTDGAPFAGIFQAYKVDGEKPLTGVMITSVYKSGFVL